MKRRNVIRNIATGGLLVSGIASAGTSNRENAPITYKLVRDGDTFKVAEVIKGDVGIQHHFPDDCTSGCCWNDCCNCTPENCDSSTCYCHETCDDVGVA